MAAKRVTKKHPTVDDIPEESIDCRLYGHPWKPYGQVHSEGRFFIEVVKCQRCPCMRAQAIHKKTGLIEKTNLKYPPKTSEKKYLAPPGLGRLDKYGRGKLRLRAIARH